MTPPVSPERKLRPCFKPATRSIRAVGLRRRPELALRAHDARRTAPALTADACASGSYWGAPA